jgi:tetratricopeptide (TPR) repeat protein
MIIKSGGKHMTRKPVLMLIPIFCLVCISVAAQQRNSPWQTYMDAGQEAMNKSQFEEAESHFEAALKEAESFEAQDYRLVFTLDNLARSLVYQKKYVDAEKLYLRALELQETKYGKEHASIASRLINLAEFYYYQPDRKAEAEPLMIRAIKIQEKALGPDNPELSSTLIQLGYWQGLVGKDSEAELLLLRGLSIEQKLYGKESPILNTVLTYLAAVRRRQQKYDEAERLYKQVQEVLEKAIVDKETNWPIFPPHLSKAEYRLQNARSYAARLNNLTSFYFVQRRYAEAEAQYYHALNILEQEFGPTHFTIAMVLESYARLLRRINRIDDAEKIETRVKMIREAQKLTGRD